MCPKPFTRKSKSKIKVFSHYQKKNSTAPSVPQQKPSQQKRLEKAFLWSVWVFGVLLMSATPPKATEATAVVFSDWGLTGPESLRFGVLTQSKDALYLSRLSNTLPQRSNVSPLAANTVQRESVKLAADARGVASLGPLLTTAPQAFGHFQKAPTTASIALKPLRQERFAQDEQQFELTVSQHATGYGGLWVNLLALTTGATGFLDLRDYKYLSFWVQSQGQFRLKLADRHWYEKEDALELGVLSHFYSALAPLPSQPLPTWRQVIIPLANHPQMQRLDRSAIANLVIQAYPDVSGPQHLVFRALNLHQHLPPSEPPFSLTLKTQPPESKALKAPAQPYHTWIWNTEELLADSGSDNWPTLISRLKDLYIGEVYLQWPGNAYANPERLAALIQTLHEAHISVHALDGAPYFAEPLHHQTVFSTLDALAKFQATQPSVRRFDGVHYDIEPYLLPGFFGVRQEALTTSYLSLVKAMHQRTQALNIPLGLSLPFWLDMPDEFTGNALLAEIEGVTAPLYEQLQRHSDYIALMDYKTQLCGQGGILESAQNELRFAQKHNKKVVIGLETMDLPDEQLLLFKGPPRRERPQGSSVVFYQTESLADTVWQVQHLPPSTSETSLPPEIATAQTRWYWPLTPYAQVKSEQLSFAKKGPEALTDVLQGAENTLGQDPAFGGIALHHSESLFLLMEKAENPFHFISKGDPCGLTSVFASNPSSKVISR